LERVRPWIERQLGRPLAAGGKSGLTVGAGPEGARSHPLYAVRVDSTVALSARPGMVDGVRKVAEGMHADLLFSVLGTYELSRVTLPAGVAVWGPVPNYIADRQIWRPVHDSRPVRMTPEQINAVDWELFWHCSKSPVGAFGIISSGRLMAMATVADHGDDVWEIGVDVTPDAKGSGLGRAVVGAAGDWILENGKTVHATAGLWNVPSSRTLRSVGLEYVYSTMIGRPAPFKVPPQPLGEPLPGAEVHDQYPVWAMNLGIIRKARVSQG
jgi:RimJ/RimL family protein N-acetyltransferase